MESILLATGMWFGVNNLTATLLAAAALVSVGVWFQAQLAPVGCRPANGFGGGDQSVPLNRVLEELDAEIEQVCEGHRQLHQNGWGQAAVGGQAAPSRMGRGATVGIGACCTR